MRRSATCLSSWACRCSWFAPASATWTTTALRAQERAGVDHVKSGVFVNALWTKDTRIGHSTALNVKFTDKSILLNPNWNPYIAKTPMSTGTWWQLGADAAACAPRSDPAPSRQRRS